MRKAAELLRSRADAIARLLTQEECKTLVEGQEPDDGRGLDATQARSLSALQNARTLHRSLRTKPGPR